MGTEVTFSFDTFAFSPQVVGLADGSFAVVWENGTDLFGRHFDELGSPTGGDFLAALSAARPKELSSPKIVEQADGRVVVNFVELHFANDEDIRWHRPNLDSTPNMSSFPIEETATSEFLLDSTARSDGVGGIGTAIVFQVPALAQGPEDELILRFVDTDGNQASNQIFVGPHAGETQQNAAIVGRHTGHVVVAYQNFSFSTFQHDIRLHSYTPDGTDTSGEVFVSASNASASFPDVAALRSGSFVVAWQQIDGIAFRRYFGEATPIDAMPRVILGSSGLLPKITALEDDGFIIAWTIIDGMEGDGSSELDVVLQRFDFDGNAIGARLKIDKPGDQGFFNMSIATLADGRVILTYLSETGDATNITTLNYQIVDPE